MKAARSIALILLGILLLAGCRSESQPAGPDANAIVAIGITPTSAVLAPSDTQRFTVVAIRASGDSIAATGVSFEATGGTVDVAGLYRAGSVGDYDVRARRGSGPSEVGAVARVSVRAPPPSPPPPPPPPSANYPNRPANFTQIVTDYAMNTAVPGTSGDRSLGDGSGWSATGDLQRVSDPTDPVSPPWVMEWTYGAGQGTPTESFNTGKLYHALPTDATEFYFAFPVWHDPNFEWNAISNKMLFAQKNGFGLLLESKHNAEYWVVQVGGYPGPGLTTVYSPNVWTGPDPTGRWVNVELLVKLGPGGHLKLFLDGALAANHTGTDFPTGLEEVLVDGTWGGGSGPSQRTSYRRIGHVLIATPDAPPPP